MQILQVKTSTDFNQAQVPAGKLLVWLEMDEGKATFHCKDENDNVQQISNPSSTSAGINLTGIWNSATDYTANDAVSYEGSLWRAIQASTNETPPSLPATSNTYWDILVEKGDTGDTGDAGTSGIAEARAIEIALEQAIIFG